MPKIVHVDGLHYPEGAYAEVAKLCASEGVDFTVLGCHSPDEVAQQAADADALIDIYVRLDAATLAKLPKCRLIVRHGIGVDVLPLEACTNEGIVVSNVPDYGVEEVAVHALGLLLSLERKVPFYDHLVKKGQWDESPGYEMRRISCRTLGFFGFGRIARHMNTLLKPLGYRVLAHDPFLTPEQAQMHGVESASVDELFTRCDALVLMAPSTPETRGVVNDCNLGKARDGLMIVNTARGDLIDSAALLRALEAGKVSGAALDVLEHEPPLTEVDKQLVGHPHVVATPHVAYRSVESFNTLKRLCGEIALDFLCRDTLRNVVNPAVLPHRKPAGQ